VILWRMLTEGLAATRVAVPVRFSSGIAFMHELTVDELIAGRDKVLQNARELVQESELLLKKGHLARSAMLSQIAGEELGKYIMLASRVVDIARGDSKLTWSKFWKLFTNHKEKLKYIAFFEDIHLLEELPPNHLEKLINETKELETARQRMLYVDVIEGRFCAPSELWTKNIATNLLNWTKGRLSLISAFHDGTPNIRSLTPAMLKEVDEDLRKRAAELAGEPSTTSGPPIASEPNKGQ
jgi:AbiV family abortive infection protein